MDLKFWVLIKHQGLDSSFMQYGDSFQFFHWTMSDQAAPISIAINTKILYLDLTSRAKASIQLTYLGMFIVRTALSKTL